MLLCRTKETLATGHFMSVINILMQLRKVCNHPDLFDPRPTISPFRMDGIAFTTASQVLHVLDQDPMKVGFSIKQTVEQNIYIVVYIACKSEAHMVMARRGLGWHKQCHVVQ